MNGYPHRRVATIEQRTGTESTSELMTFEKQDSMQDERFGGEESDFIPKEYDFGPNEDDFGT